MAAGPARERAPSTTSTAASRTTATGTACSAASTSATCAWRRYEHLIAAEDLADTARRDRLARRRVARPRPGRRATRSGSPARARSSPSTSTRARASAAGTSGPVRHALARGHAPPARGLPRDAPRPRGEPGAGGDTAGDGRRGAPASIHDIVRVKEPGLAARLHYDAYERRSGLVRSWRPHRRRGLGDRAAPRARRRRRRRRSRSTRGARPSWSAGAARSRGDHRRAPPRPGHQDDPPRRRPARPDAWTDAVTLENRVGPADRGASRPRVDADDARRRRQPVGLVGRATARGPAHDGAGTAAGVTGVAPGQRLRRHRGGDDAVDEPADAWWAPVETVSNSEGGFERVYQGSGLLLSWPLRLAAGERWAQRPARVTTTAIDRRRGDRREPPVSRA